MKQHEAVIIALERLGGLATLGELYRETMKVEGCAWATKTPFASIRRIVQLQVKDIYKIKPGLYGLVSMRAKNEAKGVIVETPANQESEAVKKFDHSYYQGLLLSLGNLKKFATFAPSQDQQKPFLHGTLGKLRSLDRIPPFSYPNLVQRSSTIDVIWFNDRQLPNSFFEVESTTDIQNSLGKFVDLQDFNTRMLIVAHEARRKEFEDKRTRVAFADVKDRVKFLSYSSLAKQYEQAVEQDALEVVL
jgi:hypothetical protein